MTRLEGFRFVRPTIQAVIAAAGLLATGSVPAAPYQPKDDAVVLERLPFKASDPVARQLRELRAKARAEPKNPEPAADLARKYFQLALAEGDPRYIGYGEAALAPWWRADGPAEVLVVRAFLKQYRHDFASALSDLAAAGKLEPGREDVWSWRAALHLVSADYNAAATDCGELRAFSELAGQACFAWVDSVIGKASPAYDALRDVYERDSEDTPAGKLWTLTRLAEAAQRLGRQGDAERHFRAALALGISDQYLLGAYADFLLDRGRAGEVVSLLRDWTRSDILLLRLAIAEKTIGAASAPERTRTLKLRFDAARQRGDKLHLHEEARYLLELASQPDEALRIALENWQTQREPRDARVLLETALAARAPTAAQPAIDWLARTGHEDPAIRTLAAKIEALGR